MTTLVIFITGVSSTIALWVIVGGLDDVRLELHRIGDLLERLANK